MLTLQVASSDGGHIYKKVGRSASPHKRIRKLAGLQKVSLMKRAPRAILFLLLIVHFGIAQNTTSKADEFHVGVILNLGSLVGKVARTSVLLAVQDFYTVHPNYSRKLVLHIRDSMASDILAASAGMLSGKPNSYVSYFPNNISR
jgi:hypothetical protein